MRMPFAGDRPDHRTGIKLTTIDLHMQRKRGRTSGGIGLKYVTFRGGLRRGIPSRPIGQRRCAVNDAASIMLAVEIS
jgi:hypothetical protein